MHENFYLVSIYKFFLFISVVCSLCKTIDKKISKIEYNCTYNTKYYNPQSVKNFEESIKDKQTVKRMEY